MPNQNTGIEQEIAARERAEEQLERCLAELDRAKEESQRFAYIVSHDFRAPLVSLKGFAAELRFSLQAIEEAMDAALPHLPDEQQRELRYALYEDAPEALDFIESSVSQLDHLVGALLRLSRMHRRELEPETVDVEALTQTVLDALSQQVPHPDVDVTLGPLPDVVVDRTSMEEILTYLLDNALKYRDPDRPGAIRVTGEPSAEGTVFHVRDKGRGIAERDMDKVFAPFRRAGRQDPPGDGMGLPYARALVRLHGGRIWCKSDLGTGTTVSFTIPNRRKGGPSET